jgi:pyridoxal phosphate enzyme (YggS family)
MTSFIAENISRIKSEIGKSQLIAVTKMHSVAQIREAILAGQKLFGENRVQEAASKFPELKIEFPDIKLHLIGPLQTNKVKEALKLFDVIQTLDREKLAKEITKQLTTSDQRLTTEFFIQVNIGNEPQKAGIAPAEAQKFFEFCTQDLKLNVNGLMCIPPINEPAFLYFGLLRNIAKQLHNHTTTQLKLSMGMSADYKEVVEMGADFVRIGSAIFGDRTQK